MKEWYDGGPWSILHGEALEGLRSLPDKSVDAVCTDPPYSSGGFTRGDRMADPAAKYVHTGVDVIRASFAGDNRDARSWLYWCALWLSECSRVVKDRGYVLMFSDWRQLPMASDAIQAGGFVWRGIIAWDKGEGARAPHPGYFRHQCEYIVWGTAGASDPAVNGRGPFDGCFRVPVRQSDKHHMTGKPTPLMRELIQCVAPGGTVLDPFMGSGTTGVACLHEGRRFIGIEREAAYFDITRKRLEEDAPLFGVDATSGPANADLFEPPLDMRALGDADLIHRPRILPAEDEA